MKWQRRKSDLLWKTGAHTPLISCRRQPGWESAKLTAVKLWYRALDLFETGTKFLTGKLQTGVYQLDIKLRTGAELSSKVDIE